MDDETYAKRDFKQVPGLKFYVSTVRGNVTSIVMSQVTLVKTSLLKKTYDLASYL